MKRTQLPRLVSFIPSVIFELTAWCQAVQLTSAILSRTPYPIMLKHGVIVWHGKLVQMQMHIPIVMHVLQPGITHQHTVLDQW